MAIRIYLALYSKFNNYFVVSPTKFIRWRFSGQGVLSSVHFSFQNCINLSSKLLCNLNVVYVQIFALFSLCQLLVPHHAIPLRSIPLLFEVDQCYGFINHQDFIDSAGQYFCLLNDFNSLQSRYINKPADLEECVEEYSSDHSSCFVLEISWLGENYSISYSKCYEHHEEHRQEYLGSLFPVITVVPT